MKGLGRLFLLGCLVPFIAPSVAQAQVYAPELYGVTQVIVDDAWFENAKASGTCGMTQSGIDSALKYAFAGTEVPAVSAEAAKMAMANAARIRLVPQIWTHIDETLGCVSWVILSAQSRATMVIPPITVPRDVTLLYWQEHAKVFSNLSGHEAKVAGVLKILAERFAQKYNNDQRRRGIR
ncbi:MAG: hypothetical protein PHE27_01630 [Alphaproteobacteria bacterium]|nr:hypothetical protein [Alphaproteobacteria bacterium]